MNAIKMAYDYEVREVNSRLKEHLDEIHAEQTENAHNDSISKLSSL